MVNQPTLESEYKNLPSLSDKIFNEFKDLFTRVGKIPNERKITHFHSPFKPIQSKERRVPLHLLAGANEELKRMETEGHIIKLEKCDEDCFIIPFVITRKKDTSIKLALDSKLLNDQIFKNTYQMPNIHELIDNVALPISVKSNGRVWFSNLDLKNAYSQLKLCEQTSKQCNFSIVGVETTGTYRFLMGFYGLGDMPNEFPRVMESLLKNIHFINCYIDDILVASRGALEEHKSIVYKILSILDKNNMAVKWGKCAFFKSDIEWLGFKISGDGVRPLLGKADTIKNLPTPKNISELRSFFGSINQYVKFVPSLSTLSSPLRPLLNKKSVYKWNINHSIAFEKLKAEIVNITENSHFDIKEKTRLKTDASHNGLGATLKQLQDDQWKTIAFASRFLNNQEMKYSTIELELLGVVWATENFRNYLYGTEFQIVTDHKALLSALSANHGNKTIHSRLTRWVNRLSSFNFKISRLPGKDMGFTDLLSRLPSGKALPISHYDDEIVVASIEKFQNILLNRQYSKIVTVNIVDRPAVVVNTNARVTTIPSRNENSSDVIGQNRLNSS